MTPFKTLYLFCRNILFISGVILYIGIYNNDDRVGLLLIFFNCYHHTYILIYII